MLRIYHFFTLGTDPTLTWSGVNFKGHWRLTNDPNERYSQPLSKNTFILQYSIKTCLGEVFECRLLNSWSFITEKMPGRLLQFLYVDNVDIGRFFHKRKEA